VGDFDFALYRTLAAESGNFCFSPLSIRVALAMAEAGARGETSGQIREALGADASGAPLHEQLARLLARLQQADDLSVANSLWCQAGAPLEAKFRDAIVQQYDGEVSSLDFRGDAEGARTTINRWVEARTHEKIRDLLPSGSLNDLSRLVLVNAIYFHGRWMQEFWPDVTRDQPFHLELGGTVQAPSMRQTDAFLHFQGAGFQAMELPYRANRLGMLVLLPDRKDGLRQLEPRLSADLLRDCVAQMREQEVRVFLPRFEIRSRPDSLAQELQALGMTRAFTDEADFSGINGLRPPDEAALFISDVFHEAFVHVDEAGTEATAATGASFLAPTSPMRAMPLEFRADHPFVFAIRERRTGAILFLGRVTDPTR
jgi:serpin B